MAEAAPATKFWHPLSIWHVLGVAFVMQIVCILPIVALQQLAGIHIPVWMGSGAAGALTVVAVRALAQRRIAAGK